MKQYNGHRSWNAWNVSLWINNDETLYRFAMECVRGINNNEKGINFAVRRFINGLGNSRTRDGAVYNPLSVKLCLQCFIDD
ncbi:hypothetical protein KAR91_39100 [Candidatus Pacearchaeota archaeon]|nr:hypothetical protein [Candidatus Pacearchaeota archaeon]